MMEQRFCSRCGAKLAPGASFCGNCGNSMDAERQAIEQIVPPAGYRIPDEGFQANFFRTEGRLNRWRYFKRTLLITLLVMLVAGVISIPFMDYQGDTPKEFDYFLSMVNFVLLYSYYTLDVRRLHDMGKTEYMAQQALVLGIVMDVGDYFVKYPNGDYNVHSSFFWMYVAGGIVYCVLALYFLFAEGHYGANEYGPDPLEGRH